MRIVLFGAGGYGSHYVKELLENSNAEVSWEGVVDPFFENISYKNEILRLGIPIYSSGEDFYREHKAELAIVCTPPFLHCEQSILALKNGSAVLCEKPVASTAEAAQAMLEAESEYGRFIAIGYQWSYSDAIQALKKDILAGRFGDPILFKTFISWPRNFDYYRRGGGWGGRIQKDGITVLDSIASNACAHYLHNMLFLLGDKMDESAEITDIQADCLRAYDIETFDTCTVRATAKDIPLYFIASHAAGVRRAPTFEYRFTGGTVRYDEENGDLVEAIMTSGERIVYGSPKNDLLQKLWICVDALKNGVTPICTVKTAIPHIRFIEKLHKSASFDSFPKERVKLNDAKDGLYVENLYSELERAYRGEKLLSEL